MQYFVMKAAADAGIVVMLDGQGADETMLGYYNHITNYLRHTPLLQKPDVFLKILNHYAVSPILLTQLYVYFGNSALRAKRQQLKWGMLKKEFLGERLDFHVIDELARRSKGRFFDFQQWEIQVEALPKLLRYEDKNSMRFSIETRLPFLDYKLVEIALSCNDKFKIKDGWSKFIIRKAMEDHLPYDITWRKRKFGFLAPDSEWMADKSFFNKMIVDSKILQQMVKKLEIPKQDNAMIWRMACLAKWEQIFNVEA
jgi:asparagine synthase (glutamine-hydrolysing)